jgi:hypothetical protein
MGIANSAHANWPCYAERSMNTEKAQNNPVCSHNYIRNGYYLGLQIDVYYCMECGESRVAVQWEKFELRNTPPHGLLNKST